MKRLMWGAVLFLITMAGGVSNVEACKKEARFPTQPPTMVVTEGENTVWIWSDDEVVTVIVSEKRHAEWI
jgi:hypothetical protein